MPSQEDIDQQQQLLATHRRTLAYNLKRQAMFGKQYTPPEIYHSIVEDRAAIRRIKRILQDWNAYIEDLPNDEPTPIVAPQPAAALTMHTGTMDAQSDLYIIRKADSNALDAQQLGLPITIKGPRQVGKSSLLMRLLHAAQAAKRIVYLDFQQFEKTDLASSMHFFQRFTSWITHAVNIENQAEEYWDAGLGNIKGCSSYIAERVLQSLDKPLVLAMDEVDRIFNTNFQSDFFGMLRSWHNQRPFIPIWKQVELILVTSTEPHLFIENIDQSPFNIGEQVELSDFSREQVTELNLRHELPLSRNEERMLFNLVNGHPYLVRRALYLVASQRLSFNELIEQASDEHGPFGDHLQRLFHRLQGKQDLIQGLLEVIHNGTCVDERIFYRLRAAGLVHRQGHTIMPRCQLYADFFGEYLHG